MQILIVRHADAGDRDPAIWPDDALRPLSPKGRKRHRRVAKQLRRRDLVPTLLLSSPWLRAWQTAEITSAMTGCPSAMACEALAETPDIERIAAAIGRQEPSAIVALVGHEPWTGELASLLMTGDAGQMSIDFPKSGVLGLEADTIVAGQAALEFFLRPKGD